MSETLAALVGRDDESLLDEWVACQVRATTARADLLSESELREQSRQFLAALREALQRGAPASFEDARWA